MILKRIELVDGTVEFRSLDGHFKLGNLHPANPECYARGCVIHSPSQTGPLADALYNWREDRGIMERLCAHGVGHPDPDSADWLRLHGRDYENIHGCDGCCAGTHYKEEIK